MSCQNVLEKYCEISATQTRRGIFWKKNKISAYRRLQLRLSTHKCENKSVRDMVKLYSLHVCTLLSGGGAKVYPRLETEEGRTTTFSGDNSLYCAVPILFPGDASHDRR